jgi:hypothetical protein
MSSAAVYETETPAEHIARDLNSDFQFVADHLPIEVKRGIPGEVITLSTILGVGKLTGEYAGQRPDETGQAIMQYMVRIGLHVAITEAPITLTKTFGLTFQTLDKEGPLDDLHHLLGSDLEDCPVPFDLLEFSMRSLREEFERVRTQNQVQDVTVISFPIDRAA